MFHEDSIHACFSFYRQGMLVFRYTKKRAAPIVITLIVSAVVLFQLFCTEIVLFQSFESFRSKVCEHFHL